MICSRNASVLASSVMPGGRGETPATVRRCTPGQAHRDPSSRGPRPHPETPPPQHMRRCRYSPALYATPGRYSQVPSCANPPRPGGHVSELIPFSLQDRPPAGCPVIELDEVTVTAADPVQAEQNRPLTRPEPRALVPHPGHRPAPPATHPDCHRLVRPRVRSRPPWHRTPGPPDPQAPAAVP